MAKSKLPLPATYLAWLDALGHDATVEFDDREWEMPDRDGLKESVEVDDREASFLRQAKLYVATIREVTGNEFTVDDEENEIPLAVVEKWLTIGEDNGDLLCTDPDDNYSVWCFYPGEGGDVEKVAETLDGWIEEAEVVE